MQADKLKFNVAETGGAHNLLCYGANYALVFFYFT
jgi:hypothetical protein